MGLVLAFFLATYSLLPESLSDLASERVRAAVSVAVFSFGILSVISVPTIGIPFVVGIAPILLILRTGGAVYGGGVDVFYFVVVVLAWYRLRHRNADRTVRVRGGVWLLLFLALCLAQAVFRDVARPTLPFMLVVQGATFYLTVYVIARRMSQEVFRLCLYALLTGCAAILVWISRSITLAGLLETRLGDNLGVNANLIGQFALYLICSILFLLVVRQTKKIPAVHLLTFVGCGLAILLSGSRVVAVQLCLVFLVLFIKFRVIRSISLAASVAAFAILLIAREGIVANATTALQTPVLGHLSSFALGSRDGLNELSWQLAADAPFFGVGPSNFAGYSLTRGLQSESGEGLIPHNAIAGTAAEFGFVGLALFLLWFVTFLRSRAVGRPFSLFIIVFALLAMAGGVTHGLFLDFFGSLLFLFAVLSERFARAKKDAPARGPRIDAPTDSAATPPADIVMESS